MSTAIRAVYEHGHLRLLDQVDLAEGQEIRVMIVNDAQGVRAALGELLVAFPRVSEPEIDEADLLSEIDVAYKGRPPISDAIIQERRDGP